MQQNTEVRLSDFILANMEVILQAWEEFARTIEPPALTMDDVELRDHARQMLQVIAADLQTPQSDHQQAEKSKGNAPRTVHDTASEIHAEARLQSGYTVEQLVSEYRALRSSVLRLWAESAKTGILTDMDDVTRFNEAIDQALAESVARYAKLVKRSQNMFLAILGHDLRNPLGTVITGASFITQATDIPSKFIVVASRIYNSGQRMTKLINDLIDFTRTHLGSGLPVRPKPGDLAQLAANVVDELRTYHSERVIRLSSPSALMAVFDNDRIAQVLSNVIGNAIQYGAGDGDVNVTLAEVDATVTITVNNLGPLIEPKQLGSIFEPLVRLARTNGDEYPAHGSLGIGLFIAREIVHAHKGSIGVESAEGIGTTFSIHLPQHN
ncbi:sensor histidine kinase [Massilia soli]|uniref:histidine kinase n=1 Tax=Massilia soli TaxID=2792854 RepID=A0ABS7SJH9_9BURK|nr:sensor histidine kinase [Massilia soli]MBZ2206366.1 sensor histidine kinase [Massilia soli]